MTRPRGARNTSSYLPVAAHVSQTVANTSHGNTDVYQTHHINGVAFLVLRIDLAQKPPLENNMWQKRVDCFYPKYLCPDLDNFLSNLHILDDNLVQLAWFRHDSSTLRIDGTGGDCQSFVTKNLARVQLGRKDLGPTTRST